MWASESEYSRQSSVEPSNSSTRTLRSTSVRPRLLHHREQQGFSPNEGHSLSGNQQTRAKSRIQRVGRDQSSLGMPATSGKQSRKRKADTDSPDRPSKRTKTKATGTVPKQITVDAAQPDETPVTDKTVPFETDHMDSVELLASTSMSDDMQISPSSLRYGSLRRVMAMRDARSLPFVPGYYPVSSKIIYLTATFLGSPLSRLHLNCLLSRSQFLLTWKSTFPHFHSQRKSQEYSRKLRSR
jgi:hypothetical protein